MGFNHIKTMLFLIDIITFYAFMETLLIKIRRLALSIAAALFINESVKRKHKSLVRNKLISLGNVLLYSVPNVKMFRNIVLQLEK